MSMQVGANRLLNRPETHNIHHRYNAFGDRRNLHYESPREYERVKALNTNRLRLHYEDQSKYLDEIYELGSYRRLLSGENSESSHRLRKGQLIIWGTHHRTGTYLAQKLFATLCAKQNWCCVFHPTRDSIDAVQYMLTQDDVHVMGHNQWIWNPAELLGAEIKYKFVHFYRNPFQKIVSGYNYHRFGVEPWTKKALFYEHLCSASAYNASAPVHYSRALTRSEVIDYCRGVQLCETCCRREHEVSSSVSHSAVIPVGEMPRAQYATRKSHEYEFLCRHLGQVKSSLQDALLSASREEGLAIEASIDYFESLRMINLMQQTWHDKDVLHVNLDDFKLDFRAQLTKILRHIEVVRGDAEENDMIRQFEFLDVSKSTMYRWFMTNEFNKHVINTAEEVAEVSLNMNILFKNAELMALYAPMLNEYQRLTSSS